MSISRRIATLFRVKANKALDRAEDPREMLDYSYEQQLEMVHKVRRGLADVATSRKRVELQRILGLVISRSQATPSSGARQ
jgi:phage shock protein A